MLECGVGLVDVRRTGDTLSFCGPALRRTGPLDDEYLDGIARGLRIDRSDILDHNWVDNGPGWAAVRLASAADVLALEPDDARMVSSCSGLLVPIPKGRPGSSRFGPSRCRSAFAKIPSAGASTRASRNGSSTRGKHPRRTKPPKGRPSGATGPVDPLHRRQRVGGRGQSEMHSRDGAIVNADTATQPLGCSTPVAPRERSPQRSATVASAT